jgi:hypothetical protein
MYLIFCGILSRVQVLTMEFSNQVSLTEFMRVADASPECTSSFFANNYRVFVQAGDDANGD